MYVYIHCVYIHTFIFPSRCEGVVRPLPDGVGTNGVFTEGSQIPCIFKYCALSAHVLPRFAIFIHTLPYFARF